MSRNPRDAIRRLGLEVSRYPLHSTLDGHLRWLLDRLQVTTVLDIGANEGQFATKLRHASRFEGKVLSFEPFPDARSVLERSATSDPLWTSLPVALGDNDEFLTLNTFAGTDWNSLHAPDHQNLDFVGRAIQSTGSVRVDVRRLDSIWDTFVGSGETVFLKSDTQGHDFQVLAGAGDRFNEIVGLLVELSVVPFYEGEPTLPEALLRVADLGYAPTGFFPVARRRDSAALTTVDVCFVRSDD